MNWYKLAQVEEKFTEDDLYACWAHHPTYFIEVLNGEYDLNAAREDLRGLIGSKWDSRNEDIKK